MNNKSIAIIGFMGCGKSTVGRMVANELDVPFSDLDGEVENISGMRIPEIFETQGEDSLRKYERLALSSLAVGGGVVATSGSCIMMPGNRRVLREAFVTVFLNTSFDVIYPRIAGTGRPLLKSMTPIELSKLLELRRKQYADCADYTFDAALPVQELCDLILEDIVD
ncbi:MAG: shikimate kinase [Oscillospiraceae bacterium]